MSQQFREEKPYKSRSNMIKPAFLITKILQDTEDNVVKAFAERLNLNPEKNRGKILTTLIKAHKRLTKAGNLDPSKPFPSGEVIQSAVELSMISNMLDVAVQIAGPLEEAVDKMKQELEEPRPGTDAERMSLRAMTRGAYDIQKLRIEMGNRICAAYRVKLGIAPSESEDQEDNKEAKKILDILRASYDKLTDGVKRELPAIKNFVGDEIISTYTELCLISEYLELEKSEKKHFDRLGDILKGFPIYNEFLANQIGCGVAMSAVIISEINIHLAKYVSSIWAYLGLAGPGQSRKAEDLKDIYYLDKEGNPCCRRGIGYNSWAKTKMVGVMSGCLLKSGLSWEVCSEDVFNNTQEAFRERRKKTIDGVVVPDVPCIARCKSKWAEIYLLARYRKQIAPAWEGRSPAWINRHALRYMVKMFCLDLYKAWRPLEGLITHAPWAEAKAGLIHKAA